MRAAASAIVSHRRASQVNEERRLHRGAAELECELRDRANMIPYAALSTRAAH